MALTPKQKRALELMTSGLGMRYKEIAEEVGVTPKTLWSWRYETTAFNREFQEELKKIDDDRWTAAVDAAREGAASLCRSGNPKMIQFVLQNAGYNPTQKVEQDVNLTTTINVSVQDDENTDA